MFVKVSDLQDAVYNASLFAGDIKSASGGRIKIYTGEPGALYVEAYDDHTFLRQRIGMENEDDQLWEIYPSAKLFKAALADLDETVIDVRQLPSGAGDPGCFNTASDLFRQPEAAFSSFWISPDRWKKLGMLKPAGQPLTIKLHDDNGWRYASFLGAGENICGLLSFLDEDVLKEEGII